MAVMVQMLYPAPSGFGMYALSEPEIYDGVDTVEDYVAGVLAEYPDFSTDEETTEAAEDADGRIYEQRGEVVAFRLADGTIQCQCVIPVTPTDPCPGCGHCAVEVGPESHLVCGHCAAEYRPDV